MEPSSRAAHQFPEGSERINTDVDTDQLKWFCGNEDFSHIIHCNAYQRNQGSDGGVSGL